MRACVHDEVNLARSSRQGTFANYRILTRTKSNGIPDIRRPVGRIHIQNVLNEQISSYSVHYLG